MEASILICTDLDRTLLPNGSEPESPQARPVFRALAARPEVAVAYATGRNDRLIKEAIGEYDLPVPDFAIGDVGTSIFEVRGGEWSLASAWHREIDRAWRGRSREQVAALLQDLAGLRLQEHEKQNVFKLSYYAPADADRETLLHAVRSRLAREGVEASLIYSIDAAAGEGLLDVLPAGATKGDAIRFLVKTKKFDLRRIVYAGDSGNDLDALTSGLQAVLVRNAGEDVRREAVRLARAAGHSDRLYCAEGGFLGMNGHYAAGILEGLAHFFPQTVPWMEAAM